MNYAEYLKTDIASLEKKREAIVNWANSQIELLNALLDEKKRALAEAEKNAPVPQPLVAQSAEPPTVAS